MGQDPGHDLTEAFFQAIDEGDTERCAALLVASPELANARGPGPGYSFSALCQATSYGKRNTIELLLDRGAEVNEPGRYAAIHSAATFGGVELLRLLHDRGADLDAPCDIGLSPLHHAIYEHQGFSEIIRYLIDHGARVDIFAAAGLGLLDRLAYLLDADPGLVRASDRRGWTPLHWAIRGMEVQAARLLLDRGADVDARDRAGGTPLIAAAHHGDEALVSLLLAHGADPNTQSEHYLEGLGPTALHIAAGMCQDAGLVEEDARAIRDAGGGNLPPATIENAEVPEPFTEQYWNQLIEESAQHTQRKILEKDGLAAKNVDIAARLIRAGADVNVRTNTGFTPLDLAMGNHVEPHGHSTRMIRLLRRSGGRQGRELGSD